MSELECEWEPDWKELYPHVAKRGATPAELQKAREYLDGRATCGKLQLRPDACYGCPDNPTSEAVVEITRTELESVRPEIEFVVKCDELIKIGQKIEVSAFESQLLIRYRIRRREAEAAARAMFGGETE